MTHLTNQTSLAWWHRSLRHRGSRNALARLVVALLLLLITGSYAAVSPPASAAVPEHPTVVHASPPVHNLANAQAREHPTASNTEVNQRPTPTIPLARSVATEAGFADPRSIRFSQDSVSPNFSSGGSIDDLADGLRSGVVEPGSVPPVRVTVRDGQMVSLDNRRLVAFQKADTQIPFRMATDAEVSAATRIGRFSSTNGGTSIRIRGGGGVWYS